VRKYLKAHKCKHIESTGIVLVFVKQSCPKAIISERSKHRFVDKATCRECDNFEEAPTCTNKTCIAESTTIAGIKSIHEDN